MIRKHEDRFSRSQGIMSARDLARLASTTVAVGGLGLGGAVFLNLVRLGIGRFHVADPDIYESGNINRQRLATDANIGRRKDECLIEEARAINPAVQIVSFREGVNVDCVGDFLQGVDWVVDVVDVFAIDEKLRLNQEARRLGIPVVTCGAVGFTGTLVVFENTPGSPSFENLSGIARANSLEHNCRNFVNFIVSRVPPYMREQLDNALSGKGHIPFVVPGVETAAAAVSAEIIKHILGIGERVVAPTGISIDLAALRVDLFKADYRKDAFSDETAAPLRLVKAA